MKAAGGDWAPLNRARFTASGAEWEDKERINAGVEDGRFFLATGGDTKTVQPLRSTMEIRAARGRGPNCLSSRSRQPEPITSEVPA